MYYIDVIYDIARIEHDRVFIIDLGLGNSNITSNIDKVYNELQSFWPGKRVVFLDVTNEWKEIVTDCDYNVKEMYPVTSCFTYCKSYNEHTPILPKKCTPYTT